MSNHELSELQQIMDGLSPLLNAADRSNKVRAMRNEIQADWLSNFIDTIASSQNLSESSLKTDDDPTINKQTGVRHTVESMVEDLRMRVGLSTLAKTASVSDMELGCALNKICSLNEEQVALTESERNSLIIKLEALKETAGKQIVLSARKNNIDNILDKIKLNLKTARLASDAISNLNDNEINILLEHIGKQAAVTISDEDLQLIADFVSNRLASSRNYASLEQILSGIADDRRLRSLISKLGRDSIEVYVRELLGEIDRPDINKMLPQAAPGAVPNTRSQTSTGPYDPNRYMFTSSNPSARYI